MNACLSGENEQENSKLLTAISALQVDAALREQFIAILTHDLKTPLAAISLQADVVRQADPESRTGKRMSKIIEQVQRMDRMIQGMLDVSLIRAGKQLPVKRKVTDLVPVIVELIDEMSSIHPQAILYSGDPEALGEWDVDQLRRVLVNLIQNAVKYGDRAKPITVHLFQDDDYMEGCVHNYGNPIPRENLDLLFKPYHRSEDARNSDHSGWGLGLTLVKGVIDAHQGSLRVTSEPSNGTSFCFRIPKRPSLRMGLQTGAQISPNPEESLKILGI